MIRPTFQDTQTVNSISVQDFDITIEPNDDGFLAICHDIPGAFAEGSTQFEALFNLFEVIYMISDIKKETNHRPTKQKIHFTIPNLCA